MIIVKILGGMGNQMFQYAMGRRLAHHHGVPLKLDTSGFDAIAGITPRQYDLKHFNVQENFAELEEIEELIHARGFVKRRLIKLLPYHKRPYISERGLFFDPNLLKAGRNVYLNGVWASEKYFTDIEAIIREEFTVKYEMEGETSRLAALLPTCESVAVHIRRGDFAADPKTREFHGLCPLEYYHSAVEVVAGKVLEPHFYVFSDDPDWAKANLTTAYPVTFVAHNRRERHYDDLRLMSLCRHNIIANSTFSWWGAWLNRNPGKIVIAPRQWLGNPAMEPRDLIPPTWLRL